MLAPKTWRKQTMVSIDRPRALKFLKTSIEYPHPQNEPDRVRGFIFDIVKPVIEKLRFDSVKIDDRGNLIASLKGAATTEPLVLCSYAGIYPSDGMADAYIPKLIDGTQFGQPGPCVWGRGTTEQLSALAALLEGLTAFLTSRPRLSRDLVWVTNYSGEMGNHEAVTHVFSEGRTPMGPALLAMASNNAVCLGNFGRVDIEISIHGESGHSSSPRPGQNSIEGLSRILARVFALSDLPTDPELGKTTLTPWRIQTWPMVLHTEPARTDLALDRRLVPGEDPLVVQRALVESLSSALPEGLSLTYNESPRVQLPHKTDPERPIAKAALEACDEVMGQARVIYSRSALDMGFFSWHGHDAISFGPGDLTLAHSDHEMVSLKDYYASAQVFGSFLERMLCA
jgi:acetylornithine deacetylase/succinyl-diaminopimelate desuccinylase-like protein